MQHLSRAVLFAGVAGLALGLLGCAPRPQPSRVLKGSVFMRGDNGAAVKLALAEVYFLRESDRKEMAEAANAIRVAAQHSLESGKAELEKLALEAQRAEERPRQLVEEKKKAIAELEESGAAWGVVESFRRDLEFAQSAYSKAIMANIEKMRPKLEDYKAETERVSEAMFAAETTPVRRVAPAAVSDANGEFVVTVPEDCDTVLVKCETGGRVMVWLVPAAGIDFSGTLLLSQHNQHH